MPLDDLLDDLGRGFQLKQWLQRFLEQLDYGWSQDNQTSLNSLNEERATLLYIIDIYNKNLIEIDSQPVRKVREILDEFAKELATAQNGQLEKTLFRFRQFFSHYRVDEYSYVRRSFDDFKSIIWDFVDQLSEDFEAQEVEDQEIQTNIQELKEAVEADSIDQLRAKSREFIDFYVSQSTVKDLRREKALRGIQKNLDRVKKRLDDAQVDLKTDHLTGALNRRFFDDQLMAQVQQLKLLKRPSTLILLDIDHFKRINDTYGHDNGDFILCELVKMLKEQFSGNGEYVARTGGEEFAVILCDQSQETALKAAEAFMARIRKEIFVTNDKQIRFTVSMGIAELFKAEHPESWYKRADQALYASKNNGRNRYTLSQPPAPVKVA